MPKSILINPKNPENRKHKGLHVRFSFVGETGTGKQKKSRRMTLTKVQRYLRNSSEASSEIEKVMNERMLLNKN